MMPPREGPPMERRGSRLSRRGFVVGAAGLGVLAGCGRLPWQAQGPARVPRIGAVFFYVSASAPEAEAFRQGLRDYGYVEGQNVVSEWQALPIAAQALGVRLLSLEVRDSQREDIEQAFATAAREGASALIALNNIIDPGWEQIAELALQQRLPTMFPNELRMGRNGL